MSFLAHLCLNEGRAGRDWYMSVHHEIEIACQRMGWSEKKLCASLAILSPRCGVKANVRAAVALMQGQPKPRGVLGACWDRAKAGEVSGPKVTAFYQALRGDLDSVVVDVWVLRILGGPKNLRPTQYEKWADIVRMTADKLRWWPCQAQAALWVASMKLHGRKPVCMGSVLWSVTQPTLGDWS